MKKVLTSAGRLLMSGGRWLTREYVPPEPPAPETRYVHLNQTTGGTISASPMSGQDGDTVTLSNTPSTNYTFNGYTVNGATLYSGNKFDFNGSDVTCSASWTYVQPLGAATIRLKYKDGVTPTFSKGTGRQVSSSPNIWDLTYNNNNWEQILKGHTDLLEVISANTRTTGGSKVYTLKYAFYECTSLKKVALFDTSNVTNMRYAFDRCYSLTDVPLFDTSKVRDMVQMFYDCTSLVTVPKFDTSNVVYMSSMFGFCSKLISVPLFDTSSVKSLAHFCYYCTSLASVPLLNTTSTIDIGSAFQNCYKVASGALALYQQASTQSSPVGSHDLSFSACGRDTASGRNELSQIPQSWGGTKS